MSQVRIVEQNYFEFTNALRSASDKGNKLEPNAKAEWKAWVTEHRIQEAAFKSLADKKYEGMKPVVINEEGEWGGYYMYTTDEEAVLKWVRENND
jgi:hypothetical protein